MNQGENPNRSYLADQPIPVILHATILFLFTTVVSFIGSVQAGLVNTAVLATTVRHGRTSGRRMAFGGAIPEFVHAGIAYIFAGWVQEWLGADRHTITLIASGILIILGIYFLFFFRPHVPVVEGTTPKSRGFRKGLLLGLANPQLLLFWCGIRLSVDAMGLNVAGAWGFLAFAGGATFGAIILLLILVRLGTKLTERFAPDRLRWLFRLVGGVLLALGLFGFLQ